MPSIWSKILMPEWSLPYNCYEIGHTWTPSCEEAALDMTTIVFREAVKLYTPLYIFNAVMRKRFNQRVVTSTVTNIVRSSSFLGFNALLMMTVFCNLRKFTGRFYYTICAYAPVFISSLFAILIEKRSRRGALAIYCANIASETVYRMLVERQAIKPIPRGEVILFTMSISILLFMCRKFGYGKDPISLGVKILLGREERVVSQPVLVDSCVIADHHLVSDENANPSYKQMVSQLRHRIKRLITQMDSHFPRAHPACPHQQTSCALNSCEYFVRNFLIGWSAQALLAVLMKPRQFLSSPLTVLLSRLSDRNNLFFGLFLGTFSAVYKSVNCSLRWTTNTSQQWHSLVAALCAGPTMLLSVSSTNTTITLYLLWKCIEMVYLLAVRRGLLGYVDQTVMLLYALSTAQLAYVTILEPRAMRPSYLRFIDRITGQRLSTFNRMVLDVFGTGASKGYEHVMFPQLCLKYTSRQFQENVINWLI